MTTTWSPRGDFGELDLLLHRAVKLEDEAVKLKIELRELRRRKLFGGDDVRKD